MKTLIIDNKDSFTFNIFQMISSISKCEPIVLDNAVPWREIKKIKLDNIVVSPGPGNPAIALDVGSSIDAIRYAACPVLGVCLGHQCMAAVYGGDVGKSPEAFHGRISTVRHAQDPLFENIPNSFEATRYHSLITLSPLPECLEEIAWTEGDLIMAIRHKSKPQWGVQFHPESICSQYGKEIFQNFLRFSYVSNTYPVYEERHFQVN